MGVSERKKREFAQREADILNCAIELFRTKHPSLVKMDDIAKQLEIGRGTIYLHFKSKDDLMARIQYEDYVRLRKRLEKALAEHTAIEMSRKAIRAYIDHCLGDRHMYLVARQCGVNLNINNVSEDMSQLLTEERTNRLTLLEKIYKHAKQENLINTRGTYPNVAVAWGMIRGAVEVILDGHFQNEIKSEKAYLETIEHVLFYGLFSGNKGET
ncbi:TetR/AcrR family transcriptional regulator [Leptospira sp. 2 VSF19]|uniref:TetR/AcrR family transcriptional regulator n=1 Tax=Leptospira soteropolitanensis TaxID=2950025 RepID=A0AAW5VMM4_9LEPT|nr:TetR/AcrR family transcriptional regulator [Leptospira soteropolitanensis]MCW7492742.1 TetR/AcrR family transcriptional regulator [Leptospira soteropolitanensis]MCW7500425.1 TetR/AcrR family transcriptional regulator [Leptospira soteropolitanensis]MCW7522540.1 TetR/AcrR family transcriptional regulator [Leptospira soteropolitanensis]MCW7526396.1 TetR/AcrR family transcriptional regulator [Leptospira soteropolitanensis]MCW7530395.1 TetR/AcrR family transcriptional regulator [Leptospira soter